MICAECGHYYPARKGRVGKTCWCCWHRKYRARRRARADLKPCRHCHQRKANRPRGLCFRCYYSPGVLALYPSESKYGRRGQGHQQAALADAPTSALPLTEGKVAAMEARAREGKALFHPQDARYDLR